MKISIFGEKLIHFTKYIYLITQLKILHLIFQKMKLIDLNLKSINAAQLKKKY